MRRFVLLVVACVLALSLTPIPHGQAQQDQDIATVYEMIAALNAWRIGEGLWPLQPNATLQALAMGQAEYIATLPELPDDFHAGANGEGPKDRATVPPYDWPVYGIQTLIGEIAYVGHDVDAAIEWWQGSSLHASTVKNAAYREVGVGMAPHEFGAIYIVVFGSRPNALPVMVDASANTLYLSDETFSGALRNPAFLYQAQQVRLFGADGVPLGDWQPWAATIALPDLGDGLFVMLTDGTNDLIVPVDPRDVQSEVVLPQTLDTVLAMLTSEPAPVPAAVASSEVVTGASASDTVTEPTPAAVIASAPTAQPTATSSEVVAAVAPESASTESAPGPELQLMYDKNSLALVNVSGQVVDLSGLVLRHDGGELQIDAWNTPWLSSPLTAFPAGDCLQVSGWNIDTPPPPGNCRYSRSAITISPDRLFWAKTDFDVHVGNTHLTTCTVGAGTCSFTLLP